MARYWKGYNNYSDQYKLLSSMLYVPVKTFQFWGVFTHEHLTIPHWAGSPDSVRPGTEFWSTEFEKDDEGCDEIAFNMSVCKSNCEYHARYRLLLVTDKVIR